jgi:hypothetical protein
MRRALILCLFAVGCGAPVEDDSFDDAVISLEDGKADNLGAAMSALPEGAEHIYFGTPAGAYLTEDNYLGYRWFTANKGVEFKVTVAETDELGNGIAGQHIGFKLQRATRSGRKWIWKVVDQASGEDGWAGLKFKPGVGPSLYLITATAGTHPANLRIIVDCGGTGCATALQPKESCGGFTANRFQCDSGLFCNYPLEAQCGAADQGGTCEIKPQICTLEYNPVCGCDGKTYGNGCSARGAGTSVQRVGSCDVNVVGSWSFIDGAHYDYVFNPDGTFTSTSLPACAFGTPRCLVKIAQLGGVYHAWDKTLSLEYTTEIRNGEMATFQISRSGTHLVGEDFGRSLDLTRVR